MNFDDFLACNNITVTQLKLSAAIRGFVYYDGLEYNIVINSRNSYEQSVQTLKHEILHVLQNHFDNNLSIEEVEKEVSHKIKDFKLCLI